MSVVLTSDHESIRLVTLNRPEKRNALNDELIAALKDTLREADAGENIRVIVIRGEGKDFCSGADLASIQKIATASYEENLEDARRLAELFLLIRNVRVPVIAAVHGRDALDQLRREGIDLDRVHAELPGGEVDHHLPHRGLEHPRTPVGALAHRVGPHHRHREAHARDPVRPGEQRRVEHRRARRVGADVGDVLDRHRGDREVVGDVDPRLSVSVGRSF